MNLDTLTIGEILKNEKARAAIDAIQPKILKSPLLNFVKGKKIKDLFATLPESTMKAETKEKVLKALEELDA